jgi:hypothetical protein
VLFSIDYPYEDSATAGHFIERAAIGSVVREKVCSGNARAIMPLKAAVHAKLGAALQSASPPIAAISKSRETL